MSKLSFQELLEKDKRVFPKVGEIIEGTVISFSRTEAHLDIDGITTGVIRGPELYDESGEFSDLKSGERAQATVLELENENGEMELSFREAGHRKAWDLLHELRGSSKVIKAKVMDANKGGLLVRVGRVNGFLPVSQLIPEHYPRVEGGDRNKILERLQTYVSQLFDVKVIDVDEVEDKLIVSEKAAWEEMKREALANYKIGDVLEGRVTGVVDFGAFVEFGDGFEGLVHISEMAWQRIDNPRDLVKVGDVVKVQIIQMQGSKISLSMKRFLDDPWKKAAKKYEVGQVVQGKVLKLNPFGVFVELDEEIHGLAHISELSKKVIKDPSDVVTVGETRDFKIISIEPDEHRLGLSIKAIDDKPKTEKDGEGDVSKDAKTDAPEDVTEKSTVAEAKSEVEAEVEAVSEDVTAKKTETEADTGINVEVEAVSEEAPEVVAVTASAPAAPEVSEPVAEESKIV